MRQVDSSVLGDRSVASAFLCGHLRNDGQVTLFVCAGDGEFRGTSSAYIQKVRGRLIVNVIDAVAGVHLRKNGAVVPNIEYLRERATGDEQWPAFASNPKP